MAKRKDDVRAIDDAKRFVLSGEEIRKRVEASLKSRYRRENRFRLYGVVSIVIGIAFLGFATYLDYDMRSCIS